MARAAQNLFQKAEQAIKRRNFDYAIELLLQGLKLDPLNHEQRKRLRQTEILAIQEKGGNPRGNWKTSMARMALQLRLKKLAMAGKWEEQIVEIENYLRNAPQDVTMLYQLANAFRQIEGATDSAISTLQQIIEIDRTQVEAWRQLGTLYASIDPEKAIACWEKVRQYRPDDKEASKAIRDLSAATMVKKAEERHQSGKGDFRDLLKDEEEAKELQEEQQIIRTEEDAWKAIKRVQERLKESPREKRLLRQLGDLYRRVKKYDEARKVYEKLLEIDPDDLVAKERIGDLKEFMIKDRIAEIELKLKENPDDKALQEELKKAQDELDDFLLGELSRRVVDHPTDCGLKARYGALLLKKGRIDEAIEQFQKSLQDPRMSVQAHANLGRCFKAKGLYDLAIEEFQKTLSQIPDVTSSLGKEVTYELGETYAMKGDWEKARTTMEKILAVDIRFRDVSQKVMEYREKASQAK